MSATAEDGFPIPIDALLASMFELLKQQGAAREIAILASADARGALYEHDNWNGGTDIWSLTFTVDLGLFSRLPDAEREAASKQLRDAAAPFFSEFSNDGIGEVSIVPRRVSNDRWREDAAEFIAGHGISNQGRVRSDNIASRVCDGLLFRSQAEIHLYLAFKTAGVTFAPLPVFLRGGASYARLEPDFVLLKDGVLMVVEVDGDTYHRELPAEAHARLTPLDHEGAKIERVSADECSSPSAATACATRLLKILDKRIAHTR